MTPLNDPNDIIQIFGPMYKTMYDLPQIISEVFNAKVNLNFYLAIDRNQ